MRKKLKSKHVVAILLPIVFILGIVYSISSMDLLRADDSSTQLTVQKDEEDITGKDISISENSVNLKVTAKENQLFRFPENEKISLTSADSDSRKLPVREVLSSQFDLEKELAVLKGESGDSEKESPTNELIHVSDVETGKVTTYLKLLKDETKEVSFAREIADEDVVIQLENVEEGSKQKLFTFASNKVEESQAELLEETESVGEPEESKPEEPESEPLRGDETLEELEEKQFSKTDSFKPIELPSEDSTNKKGARDSSSPVKVTEAKIKVRSGTGSFDAPKDGNTHPGYDANDTNDWVRTFDSNIYILSFSLESSNPGVKYSAINYRVDMDLPNAYGFDSAGKLRENFGIEAESTEGLTVEGNGTKTDNGYVESTINSNGQILMPIFVNVFGAQHNTPIDPTFKITIISAKNESTGAVETINQVYDKNNLSSLDVPTKKVSAQPNLVANITKGKQASFGNTISGGTWSASTRTNWQVAGLGVYVRLKELPDRGAGDFRGSTFPATDVEIELKTLANRYKPSSATSSGSYTSVSSDPVNIIAGRWASTSTTASEWQWVKHNVIGRTLNIPGEVLPTNIPYGKGLQSLKDEPDPGIDKTKLGVFDTGDKTSFTTTKINLSADPTGGYQPVWNEYTYMMNQEAVSKNKKVFASTSLLVEWSNTYFAGQSSSAKTYQTDVGIGNITYEGKTHSGADIVDTSTGATEKQTLSVTTDPGIISQHIPFTYAHNQVTGEQGVALSGTNSAWNGAGTTKIAKGYEFTISVRYSDLEPSSTKEVDIFARWNANSIEYDDTKKAMLSPGSDPTYTWVYGVRTNGSGNPIMGSRNQTNLANDYNWYSTVAAAKAAGKISAVRVKGGQGAGSFSLQLPVKSIGPINSYKDSSGNPNVALMNSFVKGLDSNKNYDSSNHAGYKFERPQSKVGRYYLPSVFNTSGTKTDGHRITSNGTNDLGQAGNQASVGDTLWIMGVGITTTTEPEKPTYKTDETVSWKVTGNVMGGNLDHTAYLKTTIPKGLELIPGSGSYIDPATGTKKSITPGATVQNPDGSITYEWLIKGIYPTQGHIAELTFDTKPKVKDLTFTDSSIAEAQVKTVGEAWITGKSGTEKDTSPEATRSSSGKVQLYQIQQISLEKSVDPDYIEVGDKDVGVSSLSTDIKYKVKLVNNSSDTLADVSVVDALPYNSTTVPEGSSLNSGASYKVTGFKFTKGSGTVYYKNTKPADSEINDPKTINDSSWGIFVPGSSPILMLQNAKAFLVKKTTMDVEEELEFEITISPTGQRPGDVFRNRATFNSHLDLPVKSNIVETTVYSRDLTGYVWYDDDYDGLIGTKEDGTPEDPVANIPVKLYRTSQENSSYKKQLVKESLTGTPFIDGSGDSLIKTDANGKYKFEDLPEGEYLAEFIVGDLVIQKVVIVTKQLVGSDATKNSKASPTDYKTPEYNQPLLKDLPTTLGSGKYVYHVTDVNAGLTRLSTIRLFKYIEGSAIDDGDGHLTEEEIEKTATPLKDAEFDLYEGDSTDPADKIGTAKTDKDGWLEYTGLPPGDYTLVETKAPPGYELIKEPIKVTVPEYNYIVKVHVSDSGATLLPFTGGNKAMQLILVIAGSLMLIGMLGVVHQFYPIKIRKRRVR